MSYPCFCPRKGWQPKGCLKLRFNPRKDCPRYAAIGGCQKCREGSVDKRVKGGSI